ncbi:hypothetical protein GCM10011380_30770 [Sphingomonas metalli]|uniref:Uncharacterized protein n=1 Tax=Sphingomonas metalli TaxID=1779358 RepID=A0A916TBN9_9SPHN|nr:hypothetical protein [Sphingomonas metalli]GGB39151.1 hypothetical protein GCM10011380_30770 [Sphingomonas metalli]
MPPHLEAALRERAADLPLAFIEEALGRFTGAQQRQYRPLIEAARVAADESRATLARCVEAGRRAGLSWSEIGALLGMSKQAAQQRFGAGKREPAPFGTIVVTPGTGAASEEELMAEEGAAGRELIDADATRLLFRQTSRAWEHRRTVGAIDPEEARQGGWQPAAHWFLFHYYKRPAP